MRSVSARTYSSNKTINNDIGGSEGGRKEGKKGRREKKMQSDDLIDNSSSSYSLPLINNISRAVRHDYSSAPLDRSGLSHSPFAICIKMTKSVVII